MPIAATAGVVLVRDRVDARREVVFEAAESAVVDLAFATVDGRFTLLAATAPVLERATAEVRDVAEAVARAGACALFGVEGTLRATSFAL